MKLRDLEEFSLLDVCQRLHMSRSGASDPLNMYIVKLMLNRLQNKINEWKDPPWFSERYDNAVKNLIEATLAEYEHKFDGGYGICSKCSNYFDPNIPGAEQNPDPCMSGSVRHGP